MLRRRPRPLSGADHARFNASAVLRRPGRSSTALRVDQDHSVRAAGQARVTRSTHRVDLHALDGEHRQLQQCAGAGGRQAVHGDERRRGRLDRIRSAQAEGRAVGFARDAQARIRVTIAPRSVEQGSMSSAAQRAGSGSSRRASSTMCLACDPRSIDSRRSCGPAPVSRLPGALVNLIIAPRRERQGDLPSSWRPVRRKEHAESRIPPSPSPPIREEGRLASSAPLNKDDRYDPRFPDKQEVATAVLRRGIEEDSLRLPHQAVLEFVAATTRRLDGGPPLHPADARREAEEFLRQFTVPYPTEDVVRTALRGRLPGVTLHRSAAGTVPVLRAAIVPRSTGRSAHRSRCPTCCCHWR